MLTFNDEYEWFDFKENWFSKDEIGEYISAISNGAAFCGKEYGYIIWGVNDKTKEIVGTTVNFDRDIDLTQPGKCYFSGDFAETDNYIFMRFTKIRKGDVYVYMDKRTKAIYGGLNPFGTYLLPNMGMLVGASDNYFVKHLHLEYFGGINSLHKILNNNKSFLSNEDYQKLSDYRDDDNPILVFYKLK